MRASYSFAMSVVSNRLIAPPCGWPCMHASITRHHHSLRAAADLLGPDFPLIFRTSVAIQSPYGVLSPAAKKSLYKPGAVMVHIVGFMFCCDVVYPGTRPAKDYAYDAATPLRCTSGELTSSVLPWCTLSQQPYCIPASVFDGIHTEYRCLPPRSVVHTRTAIQACHCDSFPEIIAGYPSRCHVECIRPRMQLYYRHHLCS